MPKNTEDGELENTLLDDAEYDHNVKRSFSIMVPVEVPGDGREEVNMDVYDVLLYCKDHGVTVTLDQLLEAGFVREDDPRLKKPRKTPDYTKPPLSKDTKDATQVLKSAKIGKEHSVKYQICQMAIRLSYINIEKGAISLATMLGDALLRPFVGEYDFVAQLVICPPIDIGKGKKSDRGYLITIAYAYLQAFTLTLYSVNNFMDKISKGNRYIVDHLSMTSAKSPMGKYPDLKLRVSKLEKSTTEKIQATEQDIEDIQVDVAGDVEDVEMQTSEQGEDDIEQKEIMKNELEGLLKPMPDKPKTAKLGAKVHIKRSKP